VNLRGDFDLDPKLSYLNSGTHSICPRDVLAAVQREQRAVERNPTEGLIDVFARLWKVQTRLAAFFGARPEDLFLRPNVTEAMGDFILGVRLDGPGEILTTDLEYGAILHQCRFRAERDGRPLRALALPARPASSGELAKAVISGLGKDTKLLVLSHVATGNGLIFPLAEIARETRRRGILFAVDGAHAPGALALDFHELGEVDFYGGNLHKWMMGPKGTAFGWAHASVQERMVPLHAGWMTHEVSPPHSDFGHDGAAFARRQALSASQDFAPFLAIDAMLDYWESRGPGRLRECIAGLGAYAEDVFVRGRWPLLSPERTLRGPLVSFALPAAIENEGFTFMSRLVRDHELQIAISKLQGRWVLRLSPHVYNDESEIDRAAKILAHYR
jgi:isopenicillin-N epimerase